jgi:copper homeostasis protein
MAPSVQRITIEIAVQSVRDGVAAIEAGADRLELSSALELGGLTPARATLRELRRRVSHPIVALVRPRAGGFRYGDDEFPAMLEEIEALLADGAAGVAVGMLGEDGMPDRRRCLELRRQIGDASRAAVFHRAFDLTPDPLIALDVLIDLGFSRVLTSGQQRRVAPPSPGAALVARLVERAAGRIEILPAGGIRAANVAGLLHATGCTQVHASCSRVVRNSSATRPQESFGFGLGADDDAHLSIDAEQVAALRRAVNEWTRPAHRPPA